MQTIYGPIQSRRLGRSLGIDPIPLKTCNWNCVYCQLGRTKPVTNVRLDYLPHADILSEIKLALDKYPPTTLDWVSFVGSGEPTLNCHLGWLIRETKKLTPTPIAVVTNGSLLYLPEVREELMAADAVLPTVAAGSAEMFRTLHRPHPSSTFERHIEGIKAFRADYTGKLWIEVMLVQGVNDSVAALSDLAGVLAEIVPDGIQIVTPTRPPSEAWVVPSNPEAVLRATAMLEKVAPILAPMDVAYDFGHYIDPAVALVAIVRRHPLSDTQLIAAIETWRAGKDGVQSAEAIRDRLLDNKQIRPIRRHNTTFWTVPDTHFPTLEKSTQAPIAA